MQIEFLYAQHLRNLAPLSLTPSERFNVFVGNNGQGKTNLLEAIFCIAALRSFRTTRLADLIQFGAPACSLAARVRKDSLTRKYEVEIAEGSKRTRIGRACPTASSARPRSAYSSANWCLPRE